MKGYTRNQEIVIQDVKKIKLIIPHDNFIEYEVIKSKDNIIIKIKS